MKKVIKAVSILLLLTMLIPIISGSIFIVNAASYSVSANINGINVIRKTDYMVIYNNRGSYTETNVYGYEVVVTAGVVTGISGNNSYIPVEIGSYVVSGHGSSVEWLKANVVLGMSVTYNTTKVTFIYDNSTVLRNLELSINKMQDVYNDAKATYRLIDYSGLSSRIQSVNNSFNSLKAAYSTNHSYDIETNSAPLFEEVKDIQNLCVESSSVEIRGVWIRPTQTTAKAVDAYVEQLYDAGINMLCIETLYDSTMIMPMPENSLFEQNPLWKGFDMLQAFIDSCHERDMELHIWMPIYYVGHGGNNRSVGTKKQEWLSRTNTGSIYAAGDTSKFMFLSPANPEVKDFLLETYEYILTNYDIDGFELDYIRYNARGDSDFGYDAATVNAFKAAYGITPEYNTKASYWNNWVSFRASFVTDMVRSVRNLINTINPQIVLSADVSPDFNHAKNYLYQDSVTWLNNGYLDMIHPMAYGDGYVSLMEDYLLIAGDCYVGVGLGAYMEEFDAEDMQRQAIDMSLIKSAGSVFFEASSFLNKGTGDLLTSTIYRNRAVSPTYDEKTSVMLLVEQAKNRIDNAILPLEGITAAEATTVKAKLDIIFSSTSNGLSDQVITDIENAINSVNTLTNIEAKQALLDDLNYAKTIAESTQETFNNISGYFKVETLGSESVVVGFNSKTVQNMIAKTTKMLLDGAVSVKDKNGNVLSDSQKVGTGCVVSNGELSYIIVIKGDINGDGIINSIDYLLTKRIFLGTYTPDAFQKRAASISDGISPKSTDYLKIKRHFLGTYNLFL
ncbi:MAG: hypothetical protein A2Y15_07510 [Clostridiales bacterium GWF2_36_10]|nr:MAG: hypothetical protein A2Y15_07510 [Clostridiales bacterium GWF2_36_10]